MATLREFTTRHCHSESLSGILITNTYLNSIYYGEGGVGGKTSKTKASKLKWHFRNNCKQAAGFMVHEVSLLTV